MPLQHCVDIEDCAFGVTDGGGGTWYQEHILVPEDVFQLLGITLFSLPRKIYSWVLERRVQLLFMCFVALEKAYDDVIQGVL